MQQLNVELGERSYPISIGAGLLNDPALFSSISPNQKVVIISNETVAPLYAEQLIHTLSQLQCQTKLFTLPDGEQYKTLDSLNLIMSFLLEHNYGRDVMLIALGGGVIGDLVGFAAATYQRGVDFIQIPTTLLSQVDSSVGGKTAVNHPLGKNMIGAFYQPKAVVIDIDCLSTLPEREFAAGMAEVIKYGIIIDADFFAWLEDNINKLNELNSQALIHTIARCCQIKADVVSEDEKEMGIRAWLNLGHTFGHAIEAEMGYGNWLHGEAVGVGMRMAALTALQKNTMTNEEVKRVELLIQQAKLPVKTPDNMSFDDFIKHMKRDKKVLADQVRLILPIGIGKAELVSDTSEQAIAQVIEQCRTNI